MRKCFVGFGWFLVFSGMITTLSGGFAPTSPSPQDPVATQHQVLTEPTPSAPASMSLGLEILLLITTAALSAIGTLTGSLPGTSDFAPVRGR